MNAGSNLQVLMVIIDLVTTDIRTADLRPARPERFSLDEIILLYSASLLNPSVESGYIVIVTFFSMQLHIGVYFDPSPTTMLQSRHSTDARAQLESSWSWPTPSRPLTFPQ